MFFQFGLEINNNFTAKTNWSCKLSKDGEEGGRRGKGRVRDFIAMLLFYATQLTVKP